MAVLGIVACAFLFFLSLAASTTASSASAASEQEGEGEGSRWKTRCGWEGGMKRCIADWRPICEALDVRVKAGEFGEKGRDLADALTLDWLLDLCAESVHCNRLSGSQAECAEMSGCYWLELENGGQCNMVWSKLVAQEFARKQMERKKGRARLFTKSFMVQLYRETAECDQIGLQNEEACLRFGEPCMWRKSPGKFGTQRCALDLSGLLKTLAPRLSEFMMVDHYCENILDQKECVSHEELRLEQFQMIEDDHTVRKIVLMLVSATMAVFFAMCCRMPKAPRKGSTGNRAVDEANYRNRRIIKMLSATRYKCCVWKNSELKYER